MATIQSKVNHESDRMEMLIYHRSHLQSLKILYGLHKPLRWYRHIITLLTKSRRCIAKMQLLSTLTTLAALATIGNCQGITKVNAFKDGPTGLGMYVYVPKTVAKPAPIVVAIHHCQGSAQEYSTESHYMPLADTHGFILIYPNSRSSGGCFDVSSTACKFGLPKSFPWPQSDTC